MGLSPNRLQGQKTTLSGSKLLNFALSPRVANTPGYFSNRIPRYNPKRGGKERVAQRRPTASGF